MLLKSMASLEPGDVLARPIRRRGRRERLLAAGAILEPDTLGRLARMGIRQAWIERPGTEGIETFLPVELESARDRLAEEAGPALRTMVGTRSPGVAWDEMRSAVAGLVDLARREPHLARLVTEVTGTDDELARHSVAVAHLSLLLALHLRAELATARPRLPYRRAVDPAPIALCGLVHDAGRLADPCDEHLENPDPATETAHCATVRRLLDRIAPAPVVAGATQHHQRADGSGFPRLRAGPLRVRSGEDIHVYARVVAVADCFDRRRMEVPEESRLETLLWLAAPERVGWFDATVLRRLPVAAPPFPPGTLVTLSPGPRAVVLRVPASTPFRPVVRLLTPSGRGPEIDLAREPGIDVIRHDGRPVPAPSTWPGVFRGEVSSQAGRDAA